MDVSTTSLRPDVPFDDDWLVTDKPWKLVDGSTSQVADAWLAGAGRFGASRFHRPPAPTGSARLDRLLAELRFSRTAELDEIQGRPCLRLLGFDGSKTVRFLEADERARLLDLAGPLLSEQGTRS